MLSRVCARACHAHTHLRTRGDIASHVTLVCHLPCTPLDIPMGGTPQKGGTDTPRKHPKSPLFKGKTGVRFGHIRYPILGGFEGYDTSVHLVVCGVIGGCAMCVVHHHVYRCVCIVWCVSLCVSVCTHPHLWVGIHTHTQRHTPHDAHTPIDMMMHNTHRTI